MKTLLFVILSLITPFAAIGQWTEQLTNTTENLNNIFFVNENTGFCVGENGTILKTTNGGDLWSLQESNSTANFYSLYFVNENKGWVTGSGTVSQPGGGVYQTNDGGETFFSLEDLFGNTNPDKQMIGAGIAGFKDNIIILSASFSGIPQTSPTERYEIITFDGGNTWNPFTYSDDLYADGGVVAIVNESVFYSASFYIHKTTDGGNTWTQIEGANLSFPPYSPKCYKVFDIDGNGWASLAYHMESVNITSETENTLEVEINPTIGNIYASSFLSNNTGYFLRYFNGVSLYKSTDSGYTFELLSSEGLADDIRNLYFVNEQTGFLCGNNGKIYKTTSGGLLSVTEPIKSSFKIFPNPASEKINLEYDNGLGIQSIQLLDLSGKIIRTYDSNFQEINVQGIEKGMYLLRITSKKGSQTEKVVVE